MVPPQYKILSIDPGTSSSPTAIAFWDDKTLIETYSIKPPHVVPWMVRAKMISTEIGLLMEYWRPQVVAIEKGVYQGKANEMLLSLLSMIHLEVVKHPILAIAEINQSSLKKFYGSGKLEKDQVAREVYGRLTGIKERNLFKKLMDEQRWDETDAVAVGMWFISYGHTISADTAGK